MATESTTDQVAGQVAQQVAQAVGETVRQASAETTRAVLDASRTAGSQEVGAEREMETGLDDYFKHQSQLNALNSKRSFDEYQDLGLTSARTNATVVNRMATLAVDHDQQVRQLSIQALQNAVETANMVGKNATVNIDSLQKQHTAHRDIATDASWNPVQQGAADTLTARAVSIDDASLKAIGAAIAAALATAINPKA